MVAELQRRGEAERRISICVFQGRMLASRGGAVNHCGSSFHVHHVYGYGEQEAGQQQQNSLHPLSSPSFFSQTRMPELTKALSSLVLSSQRRPSHVTTAVCSTKSYPKTTLQVTVATLPFFLLEGKFPLDFFCSFRFLFPKKAKFVLIFPETHRELARVHKFEQLGR